MIKINEMKIAVDETCRVRGLPPMNIEISVEGDFSGSSVHFVREFVHACAIEEINLVLASVKDKINGRLQKAIDAIYETKKEIN